MKKYGLDYLVGMNRDNGIRFHFSNGKRAPAQRYILSELVLMPEIEKIAEISGIRKGLIYHLAFNYHVGNKEFKDLETEFNPKIVLGLKELRESDDYQERLNATELKWAKNIESYVDELIKSEIILRDTFMREAFKKLDIPTRPIGKWA